ncbi:hypothetical protein HDK90DRAFT_481199 [Phyllosticta capitalensis]|uniref:Secreted protein n=1 Tax=Phyllosticta capitalensis TaxID=121624 RepID=A0ABR1YRP2_9PEZI
MWMRMWLLLSCRVVGFRQEAGHGGRQFELTDHSFETSSSSCTVENMQLRRWNVMRSGTTQTLNYHMSVVGKDAQHTQY